MDRKSIAIGLALGVAIGASTDNLAIGIAVGLALGLVAGRFKAKREGEYMPKGPRGENRPADAIGLAVTLNR